MMTTRRHTLAVRAAVLATASAAGCIAHDPAATPVQHPADLDAGWVRAAPTPIVTQRDDNDCGAAALAMVAGAWGRRWTLAVVEQTLHPTDAGLRLGALRDYARAAGLDAYAIRATRDDLDHELAAGRPVLLGLIEPVDRKRNRSHYEVAVATDPRDHAVVTIDPATGELQRRSAAALDREWKTAGYAALVVIADRAAKPRPARKS
jgi:ABC-type bacteriocin/lantibiotic exporter with double-glycine peptidase domain